MPQTPVQALMRGSFPRKRESHWIPAFARMTIVCEQMALGAYCAVSRFCSGLGLFPEEVYAGGVGYPPCLAGEESWNWSGKKLAVCKFCDTEFQKASRQLNIGRVTPGASAFEGSSLNPLDNRANGAEKHRELFAHKQICSF